MAIALVTGSAKGLGRALALVLAKQGYTVIVQYRSSERAAQITLRQVQRYSPKSIMLPADLTTPAAVQQLFSAIKQQYKKLDVLINTVGDFGLYQTVDKLQLADWEQVLQSNLYSTILCTQAAVPLLQRAKAGRIINFSCASAEHALARRFTVPYYIAKHGVITLTKSWAALLGPNITVNSIAPGILSSSIVKPASASRQIVSFNAIIAAMQWLLSPAARQVSGANLEVSRGWTPY